MAAAAAAAVADTLGNKLCGQLKLVLSNLCL